MFEIPFFDYKSLYRHHKQEYDRVIFDILERGAFIMQKDLHDFEKKLSEYLDCKYAIGVADGTMGLLLSLIASGIKQGDEVLVPSHTFIATAAAIKHTGAKPVLLDCADDHLVDIDKIKKMINKKTKAIIPVQLNGRVCKMDRIIEIAEKYDLKIIEDSCQALGAKYKNNFAGTFGSAGVFSFFPAKTIGCFGDGGAVITNDDEIAKKIKSLRDHGRDEINGDVTCYGFNARLDNLQAGILNVNLQYHNEKIERRRHIASIYQNRLCNILQLKLPPKPENDNIHFDIYQNYEIRADNRDKLKLHLADNKIGTLIQWGGYAIHHFKSLKFQNELKFTDKVFNECLLLPIYPSLTDDEVNFICDKITSFYN